MAELGTEDVALAGQALALSQWHAVRYTLRLNPRCTLRYTLAAGAEQDIDVAVEGRESWHQAHAGLGIHAETRSCRLVQSIF